MGQKVYRAAEDLPAGVAVVLRNGEIHKKRPGSLDPVAVTLRPVGAGEWAYLDDDGLPTDDLVGMNFAEADDPVLVDARD